MKKADSFAVNPESQTSSDVPSATATEAQSESVTEEPSKVPENSREPVKMSERTSVRVLKHLIHCVAMISVIFAFEFLQGAVRKSNWDPRLSHIDPIRDYGLVPTLILYILRILTVVLTLPLVGFTFVGLLVFNVFPARVSLTSSPLLAPLICFRVVTRGDYPEMVRRNVVKNIEVLRGVGMENYAVEVVTDKSIGLSTSNRRIREVVVPKDYRTSTGALFKARALQYSLEDGVNELNDNDWIVHLDEETLLTPNCVRGILNFVSRGDHHFGQGLITYASGQVVNWITTLADSIRVSDDIGKLQLQLRKLHKPVFGFKGSYVVSLVSAERTISFDNGLDGSIAEDCFFAMKAASQGFTFDYIDGEMHEKSPFTMMDFIQQRKRWLQGLLLVVHSKDIPWRTKYLLAMSVYTTATVPLTIWNLFLVPYFPVPMPLCFDLILGFVGGMSLYMYFLGIVKTFSLSTRSYAGLKMILCILATIVCLPLFISLEIIAVVWGILGKKHKFHVVQKNVSTGVEEEDEKSLMV